MKNNIDWINEKVIVKPEIKQRELDKPYLVGLIHGIILGILGTMWITSLMLILNLFEKVLFTFVFIIILVYVIYYNYRR